MKFKRLPREFYSRKTLVVAKDLLGKYLVRRYRGKILKGKIVETEAYIGPEDRASHAYGGKITPRNKTEYLKGGRIYIYLCYGMYWQLNITTEKAGKPECILIRALEPLLKRGKKNIKDLANGLGKLCRWMDLNKSFDGEDLTKSKRIWLEDQGKEIKKAQIIATTRIGIDYAGEWAKTPRDSTSRATLLFQGVNFSETKKVSPPKIYNFLSYWFQKILEFSNSAKLTMFIPSLVSISDTFMFFSASRIK